MMRINYINISFLGLLLISKLSISFMNMSPFIATIIIGAYFITNKYYLFMMICLTQFISDIYFGMHFSNIFVYLSYFCITLVLYFTMKSINLINSLVNAIYVNIIFFSISNFGHFVFYSESYTLTSLIDSYKMGLSFGINLLYSTFVFILIYHTLLAVSKRQLVKN